ncbi:MAG: transglutaminase-like domain-containing protein, partial [Promethearchaeota archaeon]
MNRLEELSNFEYPLIQQTVRRIILDETTDLKKLEKIFYFVRDEIKFGFPKNGDFDKASEVLSKKLGQCNTKGTLFLAFCKAVGIEARIHYSTIKKEIQWGLFRGFAYKLLPDLLSHSWIEINLDGKWRKIDAYINDRRFFEAAKKELKRRGMDVGFSVSC